MKKSNWKMNVATASAFALGSLFVLPGCESEPDTLGEHLEEAGEEIGDAVDDTADDLKDAADEVKDAAEDVKEDFDNNAAG